MTKIANYIAEVENEEFIKIKDKYPAFRAGDTVDVHVQITEGDKVRTQIFSGIVIAKRNRGIASTFTVRKMSYGCGVERLFPISSPMISKIVVQKRGDVRLAKLYYLQKLKGKAARIREKIKQKEV